MDTRTIIIDTGYAYAAIEYNEDEIVVRAAPIYKWMLGRSLDEVLRWKKIKKVLWEHDQ